LNAPPQRRRSWRGALLPAALVFTVLMGLGTWQLQRKAWKEALIASLDERLAAPSVALPSRTDWSKLDPANDEYRHVTLTGTFDYANEALVYAAASAFRPDVADLGLGYWVFTPARLTDGSVVIINRGFVPQGRQDPKARTAGDPPDPIAITGVMRWPSARHWFTPNDDAAHNLWFTGDPTAIAAAKGLGAVAPFYVEQEIPVPPGGLPHPGRLVVVLPDNHLQYAITWYGLAIVLVVVFVAWAASTRRSDAGHDVGSEHPAR
jgi:surfeit locus 1 family protein